MTPGLFRLLADLVVCVHLAFAIFAVGGGLLVIRWRRIAWWHLPAAVWGAAVEFGGWICPLTDLENWLRLRAGAAAYAGDFVTHYLVPVLYPIHLTRTVQVVLGTAVVIVNGAVYAYVLVKTRRGSGSGVGD